MIDLKSSSPLLDATVLGTGKLAKFLKYPRTFDFALKHFLGPLIIDDSPAWATKMRTGLLKLGAGYVHWTVLEAMSHAIDVALDGYKAANHSFKTGSPIAWTDWMVPVDIVRAFGYELYCPTAAYSIAANQGQMTAGKYCAVTEELGVSEALCSVNKSSIGSFLAGELPKPSLVINGTHPCDPARMQNVVLQYHNQDVPHYTMDTPYGRSEQEIDRWVKSSFEMIDFITKTTGRQLDWVKLEHYARCIHRFNTAVNEATELHRANPAPPLMPMLILLWRARLVDGGIEGLATAAEKIRDCAYWYIEHYKRTKAPKDKIRVQFGDQGLVWNDYWVWLYKHYGARMVLDYIGRSYYPPVDFSSKESIIRSLVIEKLYLSMIRQSHGTMDLNVSEIEYGLKEFDIDCVIFNNNQGCKHNLALKKILSDTCNRAGVPHTFINLDIVDGRYLSELEIKSRISNFFTTYGLA